MAEWLLKYADARGEIHELVSEADTEQELRDKYSQQGYLVYSIRRRGELVGFSRRLGGRRSKLNQGKFLIFNHPFRIINRECSITPSTAEVYHFNILKCFKIFLH